MHVRFYPDSDFVEEFLTLNPSLPQIEAAARELEAEAADLMTRAVLAKKYYLAEHSVRLGVLAQDKIEEAVALRKVLNFARMGGN